MNISSVLERKHVIDFLVKRQLTGQYQKAKRFLLEGHFKNIDFKLREPKKDGIYYFRINKQFRAFCLIEGTTLKVFDIDNHQN